MNLIVDYSTLIILIFLSYTLCSNKYIVSTNSQVGKYSFKKDQLVSNKISYTQKFERFNSTPKILLGITSMIWRGFINNENEFNLSTENISSTSAQIIFSTTSSSSTNLQQLDIKYFAFISDEIYVHKILINEQDIKNMSGISPLFKSDNKRINHILDKKPNTKRKVECFIIGIRQEFTSTIYDKVTSFFVAADGDYYENEFYFLICSLDITDSLKWVNINCIEFYQYDQEPKEFIQSINENQSSYYRSEQLDQQLSSKVNFDILSGIQDLTLTTYELFFGLCGIDQQALTQVSIMSSENEFSYQFIGKASSISSTYLFLKMKCPQKNCEECINASVCQRCKIKNRLDKNGQCIECKDNCNYCDSNLDCIACADQYLLYKGLCYASKPKSTYCVSRTINPF